MEVISVRRDQAGGGQQDQGAPGPEPPGRHQGPRVGVPDGTEAELGAGIADGSGRLAVAQAAWRTIGRAARASADARSRPTCSGQGPGREPFAFEEIVKRYQRRVYATACRIVRRHEVADDVAQEAFMRAHQDPGPVRPRPALRALDLPHRRQPRRQPRALPEAARKRAARRPRGDAVRRRGAARTACSSAEARAMLDRALGGAARRAARGLRPARVRGALLPGDRRRPRDLDRHRDEPALAGA